MNECIYKFFVDCGRHGVLEGQFVATPEEVAFAVGKRVYFSEPWGKHSGVEIIFEASHFTITSTDPSEVATFKRLDLRSGECPLGLLADCIADGLIELTEEERATAPAFFAKRCPR